MRQRTQTLRRGTPAPVQAAPALPARARSSFVRPRFTLEGLGFLTYLWVIHSGKLSIGAAAIGLGLIGVVLRRERVQLAAPLLWFGAFIVWAGVGYFTSEQPDLTRDALWSYTKIWLIFLLALNVAKSREQLRWMMIAWLGIFALYPVRGTLFNFVMGYSIMGRYAWNFIFGNPNDLATLTLPILAMSVAMLQTTRERWVRICALAGVIVMPLVMFATQSRGGLLALFTFGALVLVQYRRRLGAITLALFVGLAIVQLAPPSVWGRLGSLMSLADESTIIQADPYGSAQQRYDIWRVGRGIIRDHPVLGAGVGTYGEVHQRYAATGRFPGKVQGKRDTHSTYLHTAAETGLVGLALFGGMILATFRSGWRAIGRIKPTDPDTATAIRTLLFGLVAFLQACIFASMEHLPFVYVYIALICTMIALHNRPAPARAKAAPVRARG